MTRDEVLSRLQRSHRSLAQMAAALARWIASHIVRTQIYTTQEGVEIYVSPGTKSDSDFVVQYRQPHKRLRTPKHIHLIVELYVKEAHDQQLTRSLVEYLLQLYELVEPATSFPPRLRINQGETLSQQLTRFESLNTVGEFSVEFLLIISELIFIQEKTNYPSGSLTADLYRAFLLQDRFSVIHKATWRGG